MVTVIQDKDNIAVEQHIIGLYKSQNTQSSSGQHWGEKEEKIFEPLLKKKRIKSTYGEITSVMTEEGNIYYFIGLGKQKEQTIHSIRMAFSLFFTYHQDVMDGDLMIYWDTFQLSEKEAAQIGEVIATSQFKIQDYKEKTNKVERKFGHIFILTRLNQKELKKQWHNGEVIGIAVNDAKHFMNIPASLHRTSDIIEKTERWNEQPEFVVDVLEQTEIQQLGMGGIASVIKSSKQSSQLLSISYIGSEGSSFDIALVGCGVLKSGQPLRKVGAATCLSVLDIVSNIKPRLNVLVIIPLISETECLVEGEIICSYQGKTIEITNKNEIEKLLLADAITFANLKGARVICSIGSGQDRIREMLGDEIIPMFSNDCSLLKQLEQCAEHVGETVWSIPNYKPYLQQITTSHLADLTNGNGEKALPLTTGLFLQEFAEKTSWVHFNLEATGWRTSENIDEEQGGTGKLVRTLAETICSMKQA